MSRKTFSPRAGKRLTETGGRRVIDQLFELNSLGVDTADFAGTDRPEFTDFGIEQACVEKGVTNELSYSKDLSQFGSDNVVIDGQKVTASGENNSNDIRSNGTLTTGNSYVIWAEIEYIDTQFVQLTTITTATGGGLANYANFDLVNGLVTVIGDDLDDAKITNIGANRFIIEIHVTVVLDTSTNALILYFIDSGNALRGASNSVSTSLIFIESQVEKGKYRTNNILTEGAPVNRIKCSASINDFLLAVNNNTKYVAGVVDVIHTDEKPQRIYENTTNTSTGSGRFAVTGSGVTENQLSFVISNSTININNAPVLNGFGNRAVFLFSSYYDDSTYNIILFDRQGNGYRYTDSYSKDGDPPSTIYLGARANGTDHTSVYLSAIDRGAAQPSDENAQALYEKLTQGDSRFAPFNSITTP